MNQAKAAANVFAPVQLAGASLRNRVIKTATFEGMTPKGIPSDALIEHHRGIAAGGAALTTVAYCGVSPDGLTFEDQMWMHEGIFDRLKQLADAVHAEGGKISGQLSHCGFFSRNKPKNIPRPRGPSVTFNHYGAFSGLPIGGAMSHADIEKTLGEYHDAAALLKRAGFDAVEIHMGHGYLLSQFISPYSNKRTDEYGGSLENRMRLPLQVLASVRKAVGEDFPILSKLNLADGFRGGIKIEDSIQCAKLLETAGINAIVMSGGFTARTPMYLFRGGSPLKQMIQTEKNPVMAFMMKIGGPKLFRPSKFEELYFLDKAKQMREAVSVPLVYLGGVSSRDSMVRAMDEGFDFVAMGRALIRDPEMINKASADGASYPNQCDHCNLCVPSMALPGGVRCVSLKGGF
ncbi:NADH:flavin oxidoreductase [Ferrimonas pelagia]|uniref:NADH:flavin oxidoreductase n=1 Tax=Ferrimonas pelagia TaxID=1177826 RepID=A0ABP9EPD2_9GAMM